MGAGAAAAAAAAAVEEVDYQWLRIVGARRFGCQLQWVCGAVMSSVCRCVGGVEYLVEWKIEDLAEGENRFGWVVLERTIAADSIAAELCGQRVEVLHILFFAHILTTRAYRCNGHVRLRMSHGPLKLQSTGGATRLCTRCTSRTSLKKNWISPTHQRTDRGGKLQIP